MLKTLLCAMQGLCVHTPGEASILDKLYAATDHDVPFMAVWPARLQPLKSSEVIGAPPVNRIHVRIYLWCMNYYSGVYAKVARLGPLLCLRSRVNV